MVNRKLLICIIIFLFVLGLFNAISFLSTVNRSKKEIEPTEREISDKIEEINNRIEDERTKIDTITIDSAIYILRW